MRRRWWKPAIWSGGPQVRNVATLGGNVAHALPAADGTIALLALDAQAEIAGQRDCGGMPFGELFLGPGKSALKHGEELLVGFYIKTHGQSKGGFLFQTHHATARSGAADHQPCRSGCNATAIASRTFTLPLARARDAIPGAAAEQKSSCAASVDSAEHVECCIGSPAGRSEVPLQSAARQRGLPPAFLVASCSRYARNCVAKSCIARHQLDRGAWNCNRCVSSGSNRFHCDNGDKWKINSPLL